MQDRRARQPLDDALVQDLRYAVRTLVKAPAFTALVLVTLALGIGANTAIFSALNAVLLRPLPYPRADRLVRLVAHNPNMGIRSSNVSAADFLDWQRDAHAFEALAAFSTFSTTMRGARPTRAAERIGAAEQTNLFVVLGVSPAVGRDFMTDDVHPGAAARRSSATASWSGGSAPTRAKVGRQLRPGAADGARRRDAARLCVPGDVDLWVPADLKPGERSHATTATSRRSAG